MVGYFLPQVIETDLNTKELLGSYVWETWCFRGNRTGLLDSALRFFFSWLQDNCQLQPGNKLPYPCWERGEQPERCRGSSHQIATPVSGPSLELRSFSTCPCSYSGRIRVAASMSCWVVATELAFLDQSVTFLVAQRLH